MQRINFEFTRTGTFVERGGVSVDVPEDSTPEQINEIVKERLSNGACQEYLVSERVYPESNYAFKPL